jgi:hypothetical protein
VIRVVGSERNDLELHVSVEDCELSEDVGVNGSVLELCRFCC